MSAIASAGAAAAVTASETGIAVLAKVHQVIKQQQQGVLSLLEAAVSTIEASAADGAAVDVRA